MKITIKVPVRRQKFLSKKAARVVKMKSTSPLAAFCCGKGGSPLA